MENRANGQGVHNGAIVPIVETTNAHTIDINNAYTKIFNALSAALQLPKAEWHDDRRIRIALGYEIIPKVEITVEKKD